MNAFVLVSDGGLAFRKLQCLALNVGLQLVESGNQLVKLCLLVLDVGSEFLLCSLAILVDLRDRRQIRLVPHALFNNLN